MQIRGTTRLSGVIGTPIRHSLSPAIFNAAFDALDLDWTYLAFDVGPDDTSGALDAMRVLDMGGLSVTMPHKDAVARLVDRRSPEADALGAVNCVVPVAGELVGENTDGPGFVDALRADLGYEVGGQRVAVFGAGGAARAIVLALARAGAADIAVVNRTPERARAAASLAGATGRVAPADEAMDVDLVVNATSVGMGDDALPFDPVRLQPAAVVADIVYHPSPTPLLAAAAAAGLRTVGGLGMLVHQAGHAFRLWTGLEPPIEAMAKAAERELSARAETD